MSLERNTLMENVYPKIKEYCKEKHGLEFQGTILLFIFLILFTLQLKVVDMRWGVRDEATGKSYIIFARSNII